LVFAAYHLSVVVTLNFLHLSIVMAYLHGFTDVWFVLLFTSRGAI